MEETMTVTDYLGIASEDEERLYVRVFRAPDGALRGLLYLGAQYIRPIAVQEHDSDEDVERSLAVVVPKGKFAGACLRDTPAWYWRWLGSSQAPKTAEWAVAHDAARILNRNLHRASSTADDTPSPATSDTKGE